MIVTSRAVTRVARGVVANVAATTSSTVSVVRAVAASSSLSGSSSRLLSSASAEPKTRDDVMDNRGLLHFTTLHEMNSNAVIAFKDNELFGTYKAAVVDEHADIKTGTKAEEKGQFEWMTYGEYGELVNRCRTVLKDIGKYFPDI
jgi:long-chain acyl-CoA synthetase